MVGFASIGTVAAILLVHQAEVTGRAAVFVFAFVPAFVTAKVHQAGYCQQAGRARAGSLHLLLLG